MSKPKDPQAFPTFEGENVFTMGGMTLRDYFAGQVLLGFVTNGRDPEKPHFEGETIGQWRVTEAYKMADAMLEARQKGGDA